MIVNMQIRGMAANWRTAIRLAPGSTDGHADVAADLARTAVKELSVYLAEKKVQMGTRE